MPQVPTNNVTQLRRQPQIDPVYLAMAAAQLHQEGRLFVPESPKPESTNGPASNRA